VVARTRLNVKIIRKLRVLLFTITKIRFGKSVILEVRYAMWYNKSGSQYSCGFDFPLPFYPLLLLKQALGYKIIRVQVNQDGLKLNGSHQLLVYADDINILGGIVHTITENAEALIVASKEIGLGINANNTKYMVMSRDQNAGRSYNMKIDNVPLKGWKHSDIWQQIKILFRKKLRADCSQGMLAIIRCRIFGLPVCYPKI